MADLRALKPEERAWVADSCDGKSGVAAIRSDFEKALAEGERISLIWTYPQADGNTNFSYTDARRQGCKTSWAEFCGVLQAVVSKYFRDIFDA
jgi:hypothetical protein